jgi:hypothetical protein
MSESNELLMPSEVKKAAGGTAALPEPPSAKMIVRLFIIPLLIAGAVVAIMVRMDEAQRV